MRHYLLGIFVILLLVSCSPAAPVAPDLPAPTDTLSTATATPVPLPTLSPTPAWPVHDGGTLSPGTAAISKNNLSQLTELAVWGKGTIQEIRWSEDGKQFIIVTSIGRYKYDPETLQLAEEEIIPFTKDDSSLSFGFEDFGLKADEQGRAIRQFKVHVNRDADGREIGSFNIHHLDVPRGTYLADSNVIAIYSWRKVELRDGTSYEVLAEFGGAGDNPSFAVSKDRTLVAVGQADGKILLKSGEAFADSLTLQAQGPVRHLALSPDQTRLISEINGTISVWSVAGGRMIGSLADPFLAGNFFYDPYHYGTDARVGLTVKDDKLAYINMNIVTFLDLLTGMRSGVINTKDGVLLDEEYKYEGDFLEVGSVFFSADGQTLMTVNLDRTYVWDAASGQFIKRMALMKEERQFDLVSAYSAPNNLLLVGSQGSNFIKLWNAEDDSNLPSIRAWDVSPYANGYDGTHSLTLSPDGQFVFSWSGLDGLGNFWEIKTQKRIMTIKIPASEYSKYQPGFYPVAISPDNTKLVFTYSLEPGFHVAKVYSIPDGKELYRILERFAVFSPDGSVIAASVGNNVIRFYDSATGKALSDVTSQYPNPDGFQLLYFSEDGTMLTAISTNGTISVWGVP